jgi:S1-C subfamily serine protease
LPELFAKLSPSVPLVEAVGRGTGTGILAEHDGKLLVFTNRHVIESARQGVVIHFLGGAGAKADQRFSVPKEQTRVVGIHRGADLAVLDISAAAKEIRHLKIESLRLAPAEHRPQVGEEVFAIGHPGVGAAELLTSSLSKGIVSAVGRKQKEGTFLQVTVPMNPGNSGGPLFDYDGRVVGVCTFSFRSNEGAGITLEALNFALECNFVHELIRDPAGKSLDAKAMAAVLNPPLDPLEVAMNAKKKQFEGKGYSRVLATSRIVRLGPGDGLALPYPLTEAGDFAVATVSRGAKELRLAVVDQKETALASDTRGRSDPDVTFRVTGADTVVIVIQNRSDTEATVVLSLLEK